MKTWFSIKAKAEDSVEISIFDDIGAWGITAQEFISALKEHKGKKVTCLINSPGGSVFDALAMYNALRSNGGHITTKVIGVAASAASLVAMAGDEIVMPENTFMMIHNPWAFAAGNADELRDFADTLDTIGSSLVKTYVARTGLAEEEVKALLDAETWLTADEAKAKGFCTRVEAALKVAASFDIERLPENVRAAFDGVTDVQGATTTITETETETTTTEKTTVIESDDPNLDTASLVSPTDSILVDEIAAYAATIGMPEMAAAVALDVGVKNIDDAKARFTAAREVKAICALAGKADMADELIRTGASLDVARAKLIESMASDDEATHTSTHSKANPTTRAASGADVWAKVLPTAAHR